MLILARMGERGAALCTSSAAERWFLENGELSFTICGIPALATWPCKV
jgi:hypothetical protein